MLELIDYNFYTNNFEGISIPSNSFKNIVIKASTKINKYTSNRINKNNLSDDIKICTCLIAELLFSQEKLKNDLRQLKIEYKMITEEKIKQMASNTEGKEIIEETFKNIEKEKLSKIQGITGYHCNPWYG